ncbi:MAG: SDR family oxidoreductase [Flavobacteriaceae bacterium]|nr:SDR family oxidoreductase [Flavobacteriaceae bacterium]
MKILLTGANGYIGMRLLPQLLEAGHEVICAVRDPRRLSVADDLLQRIKIITIDFANIEDAESIPNDIDVAYYLLHSMSSSQGDFEDLENKCATNFCSLIANTQIKQVIYLSGIINDKNLSKHLRSRKNVEDILKNASFNLTVLRAGIIVGSGSASFEIIRDLCEKLPFMITPKWVKTKSQPIAIRTVMEFLIGVLLHPKCQNDAFDIGGPNVLTYKEMLHLYARTRGFKNWIWIIPIMTPRLSSYWLHFVTSTSYPLAVQLVNSMKMEVVAKDSRLQSILKIKPYTYTEAIEMAFKKIEQNSVISSWKDSMVSGRLPKDLRRYIQVPRFGILKDAQKIEHIDIDKTLQTLWRIGGDQGWYYANWLWKIRGYQDQLIGGVGLRRGRTHPDKIFTGDSLDFWRVLLADKKERRLLLYAEMKLPGEAWLEFKIEGSTLNQTATFRPRGVWGRLYWYTLVPFHYFIFKGMIRNIAQKTQKA